MKIFKLVLFVVLTATLNGCATLGYLSDRGRDAADIFTLTVSKETLGIKARVGPIQVIPLFFSSDAYGLRGGEWGTIKKSYDGGGTFPLALPFGENGLHKHVFY